MTNDVYFADQICYLNDINRSHAVCYGLFNAKRILSKSFLFQYYPQLKQEGENVLNALAQGKHISDPNFPFPLPYTCKRLEEITIDNFLIGTFFEIVAKAFLLDKGFIVHKIDSSSKDKGIKNLAGFQKKTPVKITDIMQYDIYQDYKNNGRNGLKCLLFETLNYGWLYQNDYERELGFKDEFNALGRYYRVERNMIHFPLAGASENQIENPEQENVRNCNHIEIIIDFVDNMLKPLFEKRKLEHGFNFWNL